MASSRLDFAPTVIQRLNAIERPLCAPQLAQLLGVSHVQIYKLAKKNIIPSFRVGYAVRFDTRAVARWLQGDTQ
jgi:excisionase family DNA binding protein